jgi:hypothetical protein
MRELAPTPLRLNISARDPLRGRLAHVNSNRHTLSHGVAMQIRHAAIAYAAVGLTLVPQLGAERASDFGVVRFPNSGSAAAQEPFLRGIAELHNFEYREAAQASAGRKGRRPRVFPT